MRARVFDAPLKSQKPRRYVYLANTQRRARRPKFNRLANAKPDNRAKFGYGRENSKPDLSKGKFAQKSRAVTKLRSKPINLS
ncbi:hypothetical protein CSHOW_1887 [Campylobacter showae]|uniref:Uncharacterized protein n=1 Tax=Campylobacter showae RM3277 TaxID=553219 RepID=C6RCK9_9BACT|nr:hypothetical protein CAMSH0001_2386 [Campylobacter showae RM3277]QCD49781.1 hypothetical protein CSHOW_1887 [Campylobacter showae]